MFPSNILGFNPTSIGFKLLGTSSTCWQRSPFWTLLVPKILIPCSPKMSIMAKFACQLRNYERPYMGFIDHGIPSSSTWGHCHNYVILNTNLPLLPFVTSMSLLKKGYRLPLEFWSDGSMCSMDTYQWNQFLDASSHIYKRVRLFIRQLVHWSIRPAVTSYFWMPKMRK